MIEWIEFKNFKALREAKLPLSQFTLIVGANGSGKSTSLQAIMALGGGDRWHPQQINKIRTAGVAESERVSLTAKWVEKSNEYTISISSLAEQIPQLRFQPGTQNTMRQEGRIRKAIQSARLFALEAEIIANHVSLQPQMELGLKGQNLAGVLDRLRDQNPEAFDALNVQLNRWIPEFDRILFETPREGARAIALRTREGRHSIRAQDLSDGTLIALALLTISHLPEPPAIVCLEDPDHGLHPRLLRDVRDALYRLAYPDSAQEKREPVQVIVTTHNPYFLDLFRDHPEEIVIAEKTGLVAKFSRLSDRADLEEILGDASLSEVWYSGVLGGVPAGV